MNRRELIRLLAGCTVLSIAGCNTEAAIDRVLRDIPVAISICESMIVILSTVPNLAAGLIDRIGTVIANLKFVEALLRNNRDDLVNAPQLIKDELDLAIAAVLAQLTEILAAVGAYGAAVQAAIRVAVEAIRQVILAVVGLLPPSIQGSFPRSRAAVQSLPAASTLPDPHEMAEDYNRQTSRSFPSARVPVPRRFVLF